MTEKELLQRTKKFALRIIKLVDVLPNTIAGRIIGGQLVRSALRFRQTTGLLAAAAPRPSFIAKLGIVEEESDESAFVARIDHRKWNDGRETG